MKMAITDLSQAMQVAIREELKLLGPRPQAKGMALQSYDGSEHRLHWINRPLYGGVFKPGCQRLLHRAEGRA